MRQLEVFFDRLFVSMAVVATISGSLIVVLVATSVVMRHVALAPFRFTEELVGLLMTAAFFLALPLVTLRSEHVRVQILVNALPRRVSRGLGVVAAIFGVMFAIWFMWLCIPWFEFAWQRNIKSEVGRLLMYPWMALVPLSMLLTSVAFALRAITLDPVVSNQSAAAAH